MKDKTKVVSGFDRAWADILTGGTAKVPPRAIVEVRTNVAEGTVRYIKLNRVVSKGGVYNRCILSDKMWIFVEFSTNTVFINSGVVENFIFCDLCASKTRYSKLL